ncbi:hypothetical protein CDD83_9437 [Cordyceps sp. RAO-2017]|nr:hypothetical protein CDD83_9437 [Cordyceps sp. RAO-2017]
MERHSFLYMSASEGPRDSPATLRSRGGIDRGGAEGWSSDTFWWFRSALVLNTDLMTGAHGPHAFGAMEHRWVYRIAGAPHMVLDAEPEEPESRYFAAMGGVFWSQVQAWAITDDDGERNTNFVWHENEDYDPRWEQFGVNGLQSSLFSRQRPDTSHELTRQFMNELLSPQNPLLNAERLRTLRELYDWNPEREPNRDFPLIRHRQPESLLSMALRQIDWSAVQISPELQLALTGGLPTFRECAAAIVAISQLYGKGPRQKRAVSDNSQAKQADCDRLATLTKDSPELMKAHIKPPPCKKIKQLEFGLELSNDYWSGTYDRIGATLDGPAGQVSLPIADAPAPGFNTSWIPVNMQAAFGSDTIDINGLDKINLTAQGIFENSWLPLKNDQWQVQDIKLRAKCVEDGFQVSDDKLVALNAWYGHSKNGFWLTPYYTETVATFRISPGDWHMTPPCARIKSLDYVFHLGNNLWGGTSDPVSFALGGGKKVVIGDNLSRGISKPGSVNLKEAFGSDRVDIRDINKLAMFDKGSDQWIFKGITFKATCADGAKKMKMDKYSHVEKWMEPKSSEENLWSGEIGVEDWQEVTK